MKKSQRIFKAGLCSIFGAVAFSMFFWNGYMTDVGRHMVWGAFEGDSSFLIFALFLMPLLIGISAGFGMIFYSLHLESKEYEVIREERLALHNEEFDKIMFEREVRK